MIGLSVRGAETTLSSMKGLRASIPAALERGVRRSVEFVNGRLRYEMTQAAEVDAFWGKKGSPGDGLAVRTGRTRASITGNTFRNGNRVWGVVGSKEPQLKLHESGGTVRGTSPGGYHRIPTRAAQTGAGVDRHAGMSIRDIPGAFLMRSTAGRLWAAVRTYGSGAKLIRGKEQRAAFFSSQAARVGATKGGLVLLYLLVKSVTLKPRGIFARVKRQSEPAVRERLNAEIERIVFRANVRSGEMGHRDMGPAGGA